MARDAAPVTDSMAFARGFMANYLRSAPERSQARYDALGLVLGWLATHPLTDAELVALLDDRWHLGKTPEVRAVCGHLLDCWRAGAHRSATIMAGRALPGVPAWPAWQPPPPPARRRRVGRRRNSVP